MVYRRTHKGTYESPSLSEEGMEVLAQHTLICKEVAEHFLERFLDLADKCPLLQV